MPETHANEAFCAKYSTKFSKTERIGDSGHAQATMVTEQYAHVLDDDRRKNAQRLEQAFYQKKVTFTPSLPNTEQPTTPESTEDRLSIIMKLLSDPQTTELLKVLVNKV